MPTLNEPFSSLAMKRRYEVWFLRLGLADGSGAWWFRYLLMNLGRSGCAGNLSGSPAQLWATWFPANGKPQSFIQGYPIQALELTPRKSAPFQLRIGDAAINDNSCRGRLNVDGHSISWDLRYKSSFQVTLSDKGWIGFSRSPHSDAVFSGSIRFDRREFSGDPLGFGVQGHNCGYRHRNFWTWTHAYFDRADAPPTTLEALFYEMPFGLVFRKAVLWHDGAAYVFRDFEQNHLSREEVSWIFACKRRDIWLQADIRGNANSTHRIPYLKTDCRGTFEVLNNSLSRASIVIDRAGMPTERLETTNGAVLEIVGN